MDKVHKGFCLVPNPFNKKQISRVSLRPEDVDAFVFWSKNPKPLMQYLDELDRDGYMFYFLFTLNDYPKQLEQHVPPVTSRIETFKSLSRRIGKHRVIWRYDPIIISSITGFKFHRQSFRGLAQQLEGFTQRVIVSIVDLYRKTLRRLSELEKEGVCIDENPRQRPEMLKLLSFLRATAAELGMEIFSCGEEADYSDVGIEHGSCIDADLLKKLGRAVSDKKDPGQRKACRCVLSRDIGVTDTCLFGCRYCYATSSPLLARRRYSEHEPGSSMLWGQV